MPEIKLKPCPFCGGAAEIVWEVDAGYYFAEESYHTRCKDCGCNLGGGVLEGFETEEEAAEAWNRRADNG